MKKVSDSSQKAGWFCLSCNDSLEKSRQVALVLTRTANKQEQDLQMDFTTACLWSFTVYQLKEEN